MPTANRRHLIPVALKSFLSQDWPEKELVVVDDGTDQVGDLFEGISGIRYSWSASKKTIGGKLNQACEMANGDILMRFDDDDWSAPNRISDQVTRLMESEAEVTGYHSLLFWDEVRGQASKYKGTSVYALGTSQCFKRSYWKAHPYRDSSFGEDDVFLRPARATKPKSIVSVDGGQMIVARIHGRNTREGPANWPLVDYSCIPQAFFEAIAQ